MKSTISRKRYKFRPGPGALVTAAFIGPGTITTCSLAGANYGYALLWGLLFSVIATIVLQEMSARLGIITQDGLGEALRREFASPLGKLLTAVLVISAITIGNAAFETGNILGSSLGLSSLAGSGKLTVKFWAVVTAVSAAALLFAGSYRLIERALIILVIIMSLTFLSTAIIVSHNPGQILKGMLVPALPAGSALALTGLIGTTVVPYNLFLHASAVRERWKSRSDLPEARTDISVSVILGGLISMAVVITSSTAFFGTGNVPGDATGLAIQLEPLLGRWSKPVISSGLFAAGLSSAITAPLAAAYATAGILGWERDLRSWRFRIIWLVIIITGLAFALMGFKPLDAIVFAQAANGVLLPVVAIFLLRVMNSRRIMNENTNNIVSNILGITVVLVTIGLGLKTILHLAGIF